MVKLHSTRNKGIFTQTIYYTFLHVAKKVSQNYNSECSMTVQVTTAIAKVRLRHIKV